MKIETQKNSKGVIFCNRIDQNEVLVVSCKIFKNKYASKVENQ